MRAFVATTWLGMVLVGQADPSNLPIEIFTQLGIAGIFFYVWQRADRERKESEARERETLVNSTEKLYDGLGVLKDAVNALSEKA